MRGLSADTCSERDVADPGPRDNGCWYAILTTASLSFVGLGAQPPSPEWGAMVTAGRNYLLVQWWYATFPGLAIFAAVLGFIMLGDALRDWLDPGLRGKE
jgi:peptide/nickel transport system permease protein